MKTDKVDALKIAEYCLDKWTKLTRYPFENEQCKMLRVYNRQLSEYAKLKTALKNNLISLLDQVFPGVNPLFTSPARATDEHEKWIGFVAHFWHCKCVSSLSQHSFTERYEKWNHKNGYNFSNSKTDDIYAVAVNCFGTLPKNAFTKILITQVVAQLNAICETIASALPEYETVLAMHGVGKTLAPQLIAEIGDVRNFPKRSSLTRFAGIESPKNQSRGYHQHSRRISKQGSPHLRWSLFQVIANLLCSRQRML